LKNLNKSPKEMLGCFLSLPLFNSFQYSFGSDVFNFFRRLCCKRIYKIYIRSVSPYL
jgi:hypothetical protein